MTHIAELVEESITELEQKNQELDGFNVCFIRIDGTPKSQPRHRYSKVGGFVRNYDPASKDKKIFRSKLKNYSLRRATGCVCLSITFYMPRPKSHYRTGKYKNKLKATSPDLHIIKPDIDNLVKFVMDCGIGIMWDDDSIICQLETRKVYSKHPRTEIEYWEFPEDESWNQDKKIPY